MRQALVRHRGEQYTASARRPDPTIHSAPHSGHTTWSPSPRSAAIRALVRRTIRQCLERHTDEQYTAPG
ncbi:hypothetical protein ACFYZ5_43315 [Streptomyces chartreusis]|uniref:hypothetical protein n=1 Tax=Streptomyces chartreusis TaxID=1969 RepID=UPI0036C773E0